MISIDSYIVVPKLCAHSSSFVVFDLRVVRFSFDQICRYYNGNILQSYDCPVTNGATLKNIYM